MDKEQLLRTFREAHEASDVDGQLYPALTLASLGEPEYIEAVFRELEHGPLNISLIRYVREDRSDQFPPEVAKQFEQIADDATRRGDVRQIAFILSQRSSLTTPDLPIQKTSVPPECADLQANAAALVDFYLTHVDEGFVYVPRDDAETLRYADQEEATVLITALFLRLLDGELEIAQGYMAGNAVTMLVGALGPAFVPDIPALFEVYLQMHAEVQPARAEWYRTRDDDMIFTTHGYLAASWQLAWTISRAGTRKVLAELSPSLSAPDADERLAAEELVEDVIRYAPVVEPPLFGGGTGPPEANPLADTDENEEEDLGIDAVEYVEVPVFYGTDRKRTGREEVSTFYGSKRGELLDVGMCKVSIPMKRPHKEGRLESPTWWKGELSQNPAKHVCLLSLECQTPSNFFTALKRVVKQSKEKQALVFVHGYRVTFEDAARRTAQLAYDLGVDLEGDTRIVPIFYSWPSYGKFLRYTADEANAKNSIPFLKQFLEMIAAKSGAKTIHLIAHSMGNVALTGAIKELDAPRKKGAPVFREIVLTAPDIDVGEFKKQIVPKIRDKGCRITLYVSQNDKALLAAKVFRWGLKRAGDARCGIVVVKGIDTVDASAVETGFMAHSYFGDTRSVVTDLDSLLNLGTGPDERHLNPMRNADGVYWAFKR